MKAMHVDSYTSSSGTSSPQGGPSEDTPIPSWDRMYSSDFFISRQMKDSRIRNYNAENVNINKHWYLLKKIPQEKLNLIIQDAVLN